MTQMNATLEVLHKLKCGQNIFRRPLIEKMAVEVTKWFKPYAAGYYAHQNNLPHDKDFVLAHIDQLLDFGRPYHILATLTADC